MWIAQRIRKNIAKLRTKYLSKLLLTKGSILHKSCREVLYFLLCDWIFKIKYLFSNLKFFSLLVYQPSSISEKQWGRYHCFLNPWQGGGGVSEKKVIPPTPSWLNHRIPLLESSSNCFAFWTASMCSSLIYEYHPNVEKNIFLSKLKPLLLFVCFCFTMTWENVHN